MIDRSFFKDDYAERWRVKSGSIYDGDTLRVVRDDEELKIRICGMQRVRVVRRREAEGFWSAKQTLVLRTARLAMR